MLQISLVSHSGGIGRGGAAGVAGFPLLGASRGEVAGSGRDHRRVGSGRAAGDDGSNGRAGVPGTAAEADGPARENQRGWQTSARAGRWAKEHSGSPAVLDTG